MADDRFSEKEVAVVLRRAAEIDAAGPASGGGLTVADIEAVAAEAGIAPDAVRRALAEIAAGGQDTERPFLAPVSRRAARKIDGNLTRDQLGELVRVIEERVGRPGTVTEALDTVRWTAQGTGNWTTQVALSSTGGDTRIGVHERVNDQLKAVFHLLPGLWGGILGSGLAAAANVPGLGILAIAAVAVGLGFGIGRSVFWWRSRKSRARVDGLAEGLEEAARRMLETRPQGPVQRPPETEDGG